MNLLEPDYGSQKRAENRRKFESQANRLLKRNKIRRGKKKPKRKIPYMTYRQYMGSAYWRKRKNDYFGAHGKKCEVCQSKKGVTLHHKIYDNKLNGKEPDAHFAALCPKHHHDISSKSSIKAI